MCVFVVGGGKSHLCLEGCTVESKEIRNLDGEQDHGEQQEEPGVSLSGASTMESSKHLWFVPQRTGKPGSWVKAARSQTIQRERADIRASARITPHPSFALKSPSRVLYLNLPYMQPRDGAKKVRTATGLSLST